MASKSINRIAKGARRAGRIIASIAAFLFIFYLTFFTFFGGNFSQVDFEPYKYVIAFVVVAIGLKLTWWKDLPAGIFLSFISVGVFFFVHHYLSFNAWFIIGLPFAIAGATLISAWLLSIKSKPL